MTPTPRELVNDVRDLSFLTLSFCYKNVHICDIITTYKWNNVRNGLKECKRNRESPQLIFNSLAGEANWILRYRACASTLQEMLFV